MASPFPCDPLGYIINHLFLPPGLPQQSDHDKKLDDALLQFVTESLPDFAACLPTHQHQIVQDVLAAIKHLAASRDAYGEVDEVRLLKAMGEFNTHATAATSIPLHIVAQNAGIIISTCEEGIVFVAFELSATNHAVMSTQGRLRRCFPGPALMIPWDKFKEADFQPTLARTLSMMSIQDAPGMVPTIKKSENDLPEIRDTTHPGLVTELVSNVLGTVATPIAVPRFWKNTREEVLWKSALLPWRRSPLWLHLRVVMQSLFNRYANHQGSTETQGRYFYKSFLLYLHAAVLDKALDTGRSTEPELLHCMSAKIVRRMLKLDVSHDAPGIAFVKQVLFRTEIHISQKWEHAQMRSTETLDLARLPSLHFSQDVTIVLPGVDDFLARSFTRETSTDCSDFSPSPNLKNFPAASLPMSSLWTTTKYMIHNLSAIEMWVSSHLRSWLANHRHQPETCHALRALMQEYHDAATLAFTKNPECMSTMILTELELWVACDESAVSQFSLLEDYDPDIPAEHFQCLLLPTKEQMTRLRAVEQYVNKRRIRAQHVTNGPPGSIFNAFGTPECFSVRYFDTSNKHQELKRRIETNASEKRREKCEELQRKKTQYNDLMNQYNRLSCWYVRVPKRNGIGSETQHDDGCRRCHCKIRALDIQITIYEWPLPIKEGDAKSVVFEVDVPHAFCNWRDATIFLVHNVLGSTYMVKKPRPQSAYALKEYSALLPYYQRSDRRLGLLSGTKPHVKTHRQCNFDILTTSEVCLNNGLRLRYFDDLARDTQNQGSFVSSLSHTDEILTTCTYQLPPASSALQKFLSRSFQGRDSTSNDVISAQSECPPHISLAEFRGLAGIPVGHRLQWMNILVQLSCPTIDLKKSEASLVVLQAIYQVGPPPEVDMDDHHRDGHLILANDKFASALLTVVANVSRRVEKNWESMNTLGILTAIVGRQLSLASSPEIRVRALSILSRLRAIAFGWVRTLKSKFEDAQDDVQRTQFMEKLVKLSLICCTTFDVDDEHLADATSTNREDASVFIQCSILIHDYYSGKESSSPSSMVRILYLRWLRLSYRTHSLLANAIVQKTIDTCLDEAVRKNWSSYHQGDPWEFAGAKFQHWVVSNTDGRSGQSLRVHYNLLTGELLVNGLPLRRLPSFYEETESYQELFGHAIIQIMPSSVPGMRYSSQGLYKGHSLEFGHDGTNLLLRATKDQQVFELIPRQLFRNRLPHSFVDNFFHWYNLDTREVEFRIQKEPWSTVDTTWRLTAAESTWILAKDGVKLIDPSSRTGEALGAVFAPLQPSLSANISFAAESRTVDIELPELQLVFHLTEGSSSIVSRKQRGFEVDSNQSIGTLVGLRTKLVMRNPLTNDRKVIIPDGDKVSFLRDADHVSVSVSPIAGSPYVYAIDEMLHKLVDNRSLQSKLFLCYLHGLTSNCLPDPLTYRTGTEQALSILKSAAVKSLPILPARAMTILQQIDSLTPRRVYYPSSMEVMQTVTWNPKLPLLSQHPHFHTAVQGIFEQYQSTRFFHPRDYVEPPKLKDIHLELLRRDASRSSTFRISCFGAEDFAPGLDVTYSSRDLSQASERAEQTKIVSEMLYRGHAGKTRLLSCGFDVAQHILRILKSADKGVMSSVNLISPDTFGFDAKWLEDHPQHWAETWCWLHQHAQQGVSITGTERFRMMMWFATMVFAPKADLDMIHVAAAMFLDPDMQTIRPASLLPTQLRLAMFSLTEGDAPDRSTLTNIIDGHLRPMDETPDYHLSSWAGEDYSQTQSRRNTSYQRSRNEAKDALVNGVVQQFPAPALRYPDLVVNKALEYIYLAPAVEALKPLFRTWYENSEFTKYLRSIEKVINAQRFSIFNIQALCFELPEYSTTNSKSFIVPADLFAGPPPQTLPDLPLLPTQTLLSSSHLENMVLNERDRAKTSFEQQYAMELTESLKRWQQDSQSVRQDLVLRYGHDKLRSVLQDHLSDSQEHAGTLFDTIVASARQSLGNKEFAESLHHSPRLSPNFILHQLSQNGWEDGKGWNALPETWKAWVVAYGVALTEVQRAKRLVRSLKDHSSLIRELQNEGHSNWDPLEHPESLLVEVEGEILIRAVQEEIAEKMRSPPSMQNVVMQLNMGEGKSSVIVPLVTVALADGFRLVRIIVGKPQSRQMFQMLITKLGGLLNRRIFHLPFSRSLRLTETDTQAIFQECRLCARTGGVMLVQPEHILSFKLMGLESMITGNEAIGCSMLRTQQLFDLHSRDIVDESDENFSAKFELVYTMGTQTSIDFAPERWIVVQVVLNFIREHASAIKETLPLSIEVAERYPGGFPRIRLYKADAADMLLCRVAEAISMKGFAGFPISRQPPSVREAVNKYITQRQLSAEDIQNVEHSIFWTDATKTHLMLLRGLFARGVLAFAFGQKRWRVNFGLDGTRRPPTKLAVPYRAKDSPAPRAEFSQPDVVITLTCVSYYYGGLSDDDMFLAFDHLLGSDQGHDEYQAWVKDSDAVSNAFRHLTGVNLKDLVQCKTELFPPFRYTKCTIDYFLQHIIFPKQMKEFPQKLSASGWDIGAVKTHPTTGFSGTIDSKILLPHDVKYLDLPSQKGTNVQVLDNLLRRENEVILLAPRQTSTGDSRSNGISSVPSDAEFLLDVILGRTDPHLRVILDVGAQILELTNAQVAELWLRKACAQNKSVQAAIYFDDDEEMVVLDLGGSVESFWTSPYADQLDNCLIFLDEAHTRGTDLKLPEYYRAAVTLGPNLTKDRLVQACMRMRKLGKGQSVVFCVPEEIQTKIREHMSQNVVEGTNTPGIDINVEEVLSWAIAETIRDIKHSMPLWAVQGRRFDRQDSLWKMTQGEGGIHMSNSQAKGFLEDEGQTIERRYRPGIEFSAETTRSPGTSSRRLRAIDDLCASDGIFFTDNTTLQEEQERELAPEVEEERQIERPAPAGPAKHSVHAHVRKFVSSGVLVDSSDAFMPAFISLRETTASAHLDPRLFPRDILVTGDFARTIQGGTASGLVSDAYQRPVQWILTSQASERKHVIVISPHEAQVLLPEIQKSSKTTLHVYSPRPSQEFSPLDKLDLYTVPSSPIVPCTPFPLRLRAQLNLFAGQLYLGSMSEYVELCDMLRLSRHEADEGTSISADGFILSSTSGTISAIIEASTFTSSPVKFLKVFLAKTRRDCQSIEKTHLGKILDGALLQENDLQS